MRFALIVTGALALAAVAGCSKKDAAAGDGAQGSSASASPEAKEIFTQRCSTCHGQNGKGDGPAAAALNPKPQNYTNPEWQKSVTDEELRKVIIGGGAAVGKSPLMPPNPDLANKPEVVNGLVAIVRSFKGK